MDGLGQGLVGLVAKERAANRAEARWSDASSTASRIGPTGSGKNWKATTAMFRNECSPHGRPATQPRLIVQVHSRWLRHSLR